MLNVSRLLFSSLLCFASAKTFRVLGYLRLVFLNYRKIELKLIAIQTSKMQQTNNVILGVGCRLQFHLKM